MPEIMQSNVEILYENHQPHSIKIGMKEILCVGACII